MFERGVLGIQVLHHKTIIYDQSFAIYMRATFLSAQLISHAIANQSLQSLNKHFS